MLWTATAAAVISTLALTLFAFSFPTDLIAYALAVVVGITNAILWIMWGELYSRTKTSFSVKEPQAFLPSHPPHSVDLRTRFVGSNSPNVCRSRFTRKIFRRSWLRLRVFQHKLQGKTFRNAKTARQYSENSGRRCAGKLAEG